MSLADKLKNNLFYLVAGGIYTFALAAACLSCTYIEVTDGRVLAVALLAMAFFCLWFYNRYSFWIGLCLMLGGALITWLYLHTHDYEVAWFTRLPDLADLISHIQGLTRYYERYAVLGTIIIVGFALVTATAIRNRGGFYLLGLLGFGVFGMIGYLQYAVAQRYLLCFLFVFITLLTRRLSRAAATQGGDLAINVSGLLLLPICLALVWMAWLTPQPKAASTRSIRDNVVFNLSALDEFFYGTFTPKYFSFATTGFSPGGNRLGGNVSPNERYVMEVYTSEGQRPYLAGAYKDTYGGDRWSWSAEEAVLPIFDEAARYAGWADVGDNDLSLRMLAQLMGREVDREALWSDSIMDYYVLAVYPGRATRSIFAPAETMMARHWQALGDPARATSRSAQTSTVRTLLYARARTPFDPEADLTFRRTGQGALESGGTMASGTTYTVGYRDAMLHTMDSDTLYRRLTSAGYLDTEGQTRAELLPYLTLPDTLPQRVRDLAQAIVEEAGAATPYAKMRALEQYLHRFPYTLSPGPVPQGVDFVDYFLFEGQQGYCTYYATALAVLGRCVGVPTRYAEGYVLPSAPNDEGGFDVTNAQAHAWCEAFFPLWGWTGFEATAPFAQSFYNSRVDTPSHDTYEAEDYPDVADFDEDALMAEVRDRDRDRTQTTAPADGAGDEAPGGSRLALFLLTLLGLGLAAAAVLGGRYWLYMRRLRHLEALPNREAVLAYYRRILRLLDTRGVPLLPGETADAYGARLDGARGGGPHHRLALIFCRAAYSPHAVSDDQRQALAEGYRQLLMAADATSYDRLKALAERYVLGKY